MSIGLQMLVNGGDAEGLFRGAFMQSGSPLPVGSYKHGQFDYDAIVQQTGCSNATDTLDCLRELPIDLLMSAIRERPNRLSYQVNFTRNRDRNTNMHLVQGITRGWLPRADGLFLVDNPQKLILEGR